MVKQNIYIFQFLNFRLPKFFFYSTFWSQALIWDYTIVLSTIFFFNGLNSLVAKFCFLKFLNRFNGEDPNIN
jgi:hypothetical protein